MNYRFNTLGLTVYISAAIILIDHTGSFKSALLDFQKESQAELLKASVC